MSDRAPFNILFLCTGNSARSVFGEFITRQLGRNRFNAYSAGADPAGKVNPFTIKVLEERLKIDASDARSKSWDEFDEEGVQFDFVITVCDNAKESCPVWPGQPVIAHWSSPDPASFEGTDEEKEDYFYKVAMQIKRRVEFFCSFPLEKLDKHRLQNVSDEVGRSEELES
ncbi:MAG: arsenate reductase ArsC [Verrucomicrobiota bacterium]